MATIQLMNALFYKGGTSGVSELVGNEWANDPAARRVARYTFTAPDVGANHIHMTFHISGLDDGAKIPLRFFIGKDPESHVKAGPESPYTGELTLASDYLSMTGEADVLLLPGQTYYLWLFPGSTSHGYYLWYRRDYTSTMDMDGAAFVVPVIVDGVWRKMMLHVVKDGKFFLIAPCVVKDGKWHYFGAPN